MESLWQGPVALGGRRGVRSRDDRFRALFEEYYSAVEKFFARRGFSNEEAADLAQETFTRAYQKFDSVRDREAVRSWLFAVAINVLRNTLRSRQAGKRSADEVSFEETVDSAGERPGPAPGREGEEDVLDKLLTRERQELLRGALDELPPRMREAVFLRVGRDLKYREIAAIQQVSVDTIKAQMLQARKRLRELLSEHFSGIDF